MSFLSFSQSHLLFEISTFEQTPGKFFRFTTMPLVRIKDDLGKKKGDAIGSLGHGGCGSGQNPASSPGFLTEKGVGEVEGLTGARFDAGVGVEGLPAMAGGGTRRRRPLELLSRRTPGLGKEKGGAVGSSRGREGCWSSARQGRWACGVCEDSRPRLL
jgi:hypothetical protein